MAFSSSFRQIAWLAFIFALILLVAIGIIAYHTTTLLVTTESWVAHTHEVQALLEDIRADILAAEYSRRGFTITNDEVLLKNYRTSLEDIPQKMMLLRRLTKDNASRKTDFDHLQSLIDRSLALQAGSVELRRQGRPNLQQDIETTHETAQLADQTDAIIHGIEDDETRLLSERRAASQTAYRHTLQVLAMAFLVVLILLGAEFSLLNIEFRRHARTERMARQSRELVNAFFSSSTVGFGILDGALRCTRVNEVMARMAGVAPDILAGKPVNEIFGELGLHTDAVLRDVIRSGQSIVDYEIPVAGPHSSGQVHYWSLNYFPIRDPQRQVTQVGIIAIDVTGRRNAERAIRRLSARLLNLQDQERRRIAREIHDSLGQYLAGVKISLDMLANPAYRTKTDLLAECRELIERCITETRTISYLLHPPLLDEAGFASAASWFVNGFSQRSGMPVVLDLPPNLPRMPNEVEIALFRVLQESLTNVHRHSDSKSAEIHLTLPSGQVKLEVTDHGHGIAPQLLQQMQVDGTANGVGLAGMRERIHELGGQFAVHSNSQGTSIRVAIPLSAAAETAATAAGVNRKQNTPAA